MIVLGADTHKRSHTIAAVVAVEFPRFGGQAGFRRVAVLLGGDCG
jgi:hypothetical protein